MRKKSKNTAVISVSNQEESNIEGMVTADCLVAVSYTHLLRAVLLHEEDGRYYAMYAYNEIQVKAAGWLTLLAVDLPVTLEMLGKMADELAQALQLSLIHILELYCSLILGFGY